MSTHTWPADRVERRPLAALIPYARNARTHTPEQIEQLCNSIREWGWTIPVLIDPEGEIIAGHARVQAAARLGFSEVPCMTAHGWSEAQKRAYVLADNQLALNAGWDDDLLAAELADLRELDFNLDLTGLDTRYLSQELADSARHTDAAHIRALEAQAAAATEPPDQAPSNSQPDPGYDAQMRAPAQPLLPIVPEYAEHHTAFIILCDNRIDEAWLRQRLGLTQPRRSYQQANKTGPSYILSATDLRDLL